MGGCAHITQGGADSVSDIKALAGRSGPSTVLLQTCGTEPQLLELGTGGVRGNSGLCSMYVCGIETA